MLRYNAMEYKDGELLAHLKVKQRLYPRLKSESNVKVCYFLQFIEVSVYPMSQNTMTHKTLFVTV